MKKLSIFCVMLLLVMTFLPGCAYRNKNIDNEMNTRTVVLVLLDEASVQLNSRAFKTNIDPIFLNTLLTSRHYHISFLYSSQKFKLTDALMRSVTQKCINCHKVWRFMVQDVYDADEIDFSILSLISYILDTPLVRLQLSLLYAKYLPFIL